MPNASLGCKMNNDIRLKRFEQCHDSAMVRKVSCLVLDLISLKEVTNSVVAQSLEYQVIGITNIKKLISKVIDIAS
jgi:hypothetical protein